MDEKTIIKISKRIDYLIHKRHRSLRHIQKAISNEGTFWLNSVRINKQDIISILSMIGEGNQDIKIRAERFYHLGFSLGKVIDLGNVINTIYTLLQLFEEFDVYMKGNGTSPTLENNMILRMVLPQNIESFSKLQFSSEKKFMMSEDYRESLFNIHKENIEEMKGSPSQSSHQRQHHSAEPHHSNEIKIDLKFKNPLPIYEQHYNNYDSYIQSVSELGNKLLSNEINQTGSSIINKIHATKVDSRTPVFRVFSTHIVPFELDYCSVLNLLIDMLIIIYNKMFDQQFLNPQILVHVEKIDSIITSRIIKTICDDINKVAKTLAVRQLAKLNKMLKMDSLPPRNGNDLSRVSYEDNQFDIPGIDIKKNKLDQQIIRQAQQQQQMNQTNN